MTANLTARPATPDDPATGATGVGLGHNPTLWPKPGDVVELGVDRLGRVRRHVIRPR